MIATVLLHEVTSLPKFRIEPLECVLFKHVEVAEAIRRRLVVEVWDILRYGACVRLVARSVYLLSSVLGRQARHEVAVALEVGV